MMHLNTFLSSVVNLLPFLFVIVMAGSLNTTSVLPFGSWLVQENGSRESPSNPNA